MNRRKFCSKTLIAGFSSILGAPVVYGEYLPFGLKPIAISDKIDFYTLPGKHPGLTVLNDRPVNAETPAHLLDDRLTPNELFFVRNNGLPPKNPSAANWSLKIEGESCQSPQSFSLSTLKKSFDVVSLDITLECGGNGRSEFYPPAKGNQWTTGAVGCARWTGVRLKDVLTKVGLKKDAVYIGYYGADTHLSGDSSKDPISRGVPIEKALDENSLIAWSMNGEDLPLLNGYPLRLIFGGYPASSSGKWLEKIVIRNKVHDGTKMGGSSYRIPCDPVAPGTKVKDEDMCIIEKMPVKSLISFPRSGAMIKTNKQLPVRGKAWTSAGRITKVEISKDFGMHWFECSLTDSTNQFAWQSFETQLSFEEPGYYEIWAKATDEDGETQPMLLPGWNPKGYLNNACHRIAIKVS